MQGELQDKVVFILFFQGVQLHARVKKICEGFRATLYQFPHSPTEQDRMTQSVEQRISELELVIRTTKDHAHSQLMQIAMEIETWQAKVSKSRVWPRCGTVFAERLISYIWLVDSFR